MDFLSKNSVFWWKKVVVDLKFNDFYSKKKDHKKNEIRSFVELELLYPTMQ